MKRKTTKILMGTGAVIAGAASVAGATYKFTKEMMAVALDREKPKINGKAHDRFSGSRGQEKTFEELMIMSEKLKAGDCQVVQITAPDGIELVGHWHGCDTAKRVIIAMHGWRSSWHKDFGVISDFWHKNNCSVLYAEQRGQGKSGGKYMGFGLTERYDCLEWVKWVNENGNSRLPVYLCGISMGAATVLMAAGLELPENVHGIMADCGFTSPHNIWKYVIENNLGLSYNGITSAIANDICKKKIQVTPRDYSCVEAMRECKVPVLFVHGSDDHFVPVEMTYENYKACTAPKHLLIVPGAEHGMSYMVDRKGYEQAVISFWKEFDGYKKPCNTDSQAYPEIN